MSLASLAVPVEHSVSDTVSNILGWFRKAVPMPDHRNIHVQLGCHLEEVAEMLETIAPVASSVQNSEHITLSKDVINFMQRQFKAYSNGAELVIEDIDRRAMLDALCDQVVTAIGLAYMLELDIEGGLKEVNRANYSKFDSDGNPIFNASGKIIKGPQYVAPDLTEFV